MPIIPFIYDDEENIELVIKKTKESGGNYVLDGGLTLGGYCKTHFYKTLDKYYPDLIEKYEKLYNDSNFFNEYNKRIHKLVLTYCKKYKINNYIPRPINFHPKNLRINKRIAEIFYIKARELQITGQIGYKEWGFRKIAWVLDDLKQDIKSIYDTYGINGLKKIKGIGDVNSKRIEDLIKKKILIYRIFDDSHK
jgi:DNA repair photolyase